MDSGRTTEVGLRVASYNVRYAGLDVGQRAWERRRDAVADAVALYRPDVVGIQECWLDQLPDLRARLPEYDWVAHVAERGEHTPVGYRPERLEVIESGQVGLSPSREPGSVGWDARIPRLCTWATFRDRERGVAFDCRNVHFDHRGALARRESARQIAADVGSGPTLVLGDLNARPLSGPYRLLTRDLSDARAAADRVFGPGGTYVGFSDEGPGGGENPRGPGEQAHDDGGEPAGPHVAVAGTERLDHVLVDEFAVDRYAVGAAVAGDGRYPSDHLPVVVDLRPRGNSASV